MLPDFPDLPETPVSRQIECVSCRHLFSTTEEIITPFQRAINVFRLRGRRRVIDHRSSDSVLMQNVIPESDAQPRHYQTPEEHNQQMHPHDTIICPRCGTNNQNWAHVRANLRASWLQQPIILVCLAVVFLLLATSWRQMLDAQVPLQYQVILLSLGVLLFVFVLPRGLLRLWTYIFRQDQMRRFLPQMRSMWDRIPLPLRVYSIYFVSLVVVLALIAIAIPWSTFLVDDTITPDRTLVTRVDNILTNSPIDGNSDLAPFRVAASTTQLINVVNQVEQTCNLTPISSIIVLLESRLAANPVDPAAILIRDSLNDLHTLNTNYNSTCQADLHDRAVASVNAFRSQQDTACENGDAAACGLVKFLDNQIADLSKLNLYISDEMPLNADLLIPENPAVPVPITTIQTVLMRLRPIATAPPSQEIATRIEQNLKPLEEWAKTAVPNRPWFTAGGTYLEIWLITFGIAGFIAILAPLIIAYETAAQARQHLPTPVYSAVSRLTPVVIWEVANTLTIAEPILAGIQWRNAQRNELGGINLHGLFHDVIASQEYGFPEDYVRAHHYVIKSNRWGHIVDARIFDDIVPPPPGIDAPGGILLPDVSS
jgi:hypothetical protein